MSHFLHWHHSGHRRVKPQGSDASRKLSACVAVLIRVPERSPNQQGTDLGTCQASLRGHILLDTFFLLRGRGCCLLAFLLHSCQHLHALLGFPRAAAERGEHIGLSPLLFPFKSYLHTICGKWLFLSFFLLRLFFFFSVKYHQGKKKLQR